MDLRKTLPIVLAVLVVAPTAARAQSDATGVEAGGHFQRAVALYGEADYRAALVEFKRAFEIQPNAAVLYNIGQTYYQLQDYAEALGAFERYLNDGGPKAVHRAEVVSSIAVLKTRVGHIDIASNVAGSEVTIDDESVGKTPLGQPIIVSIGRRKVRVSAPEHVAVERFVEVSAGDTVPLSVTLESTATPRVRLVGSTAAPGPSGPSSGLVTGAWIATGVLATGAIITGILALSAESSLSNARDTYPGVRDDLDSKTSRTTAFAVVTDVLGAAAIIGGGISLYLTIKRSNASGASGATVGLGTLPGGVKLQGTF